MKIFSKPNALLIGFALLGMMAALPVTARASRPVATDSRIKTLVYSENEVFNLVVHYGYQSSIEFGKNEEIQTISVGDAFSWQITPVDNRLFIKPMEDNIRTNMTIITDKRTYNFDLTSREVTDQADDQITYVVRFYYPDDSLLAQRPAQGYDYYPAVARARLMPSTRASTAPLAQPNFGGMPPQQPMPFAALPPPPPEVTVASGQPGIPASALGYNFNYSITGPDGVAPVKIYDDGKTTYFEFEQSARRPAIFVVDSSGTELPVNAAQRGNAIVVNMVANQFALRSGSDVVRVFNEKR